MGQLSAPSPAWRRAAGPWSRARRRRWVRPDDLAYVTSIFAAIPSLPRAELARLTTRMIDRMDEIDGDPDAEVTGEDDEPEMDLDLTGDDGCGLVEINGQSLWGSSEDDAGSMVPVYGVDQTGEPIGQREAPIYPLQENRHD